MTYPSEAYRFLQMVDYSLLRTIVRSVNCDLHATCASALVPLFGSHKSGWELLSSLLNAEVEQTVQEECLFREESIASKVISEFARRFGGGYLQNTINPLITSLSKGKHSHEIDRTKIQSADPSLSPENCEKIALKATKELQKKVTLFLGAIFNSVRDLPLPIVLLARLLSQSVGMKYGEDKGLLSLSGFIFLRFICPAILAPDPALISSLCKDKAHEQRLRRSLVLTAKVIQNLANGVQFKEPHMQAFNSFVIEQLQRRNEFFKDILKVADTQECIHLATQEVCSLLNLPQDLNNCISILSQQIITKNFYHIKKRSKQDGTLERLKKLFQALPSFQSATITKEAVLAPEVKSEDLDPSKWNAQRVNKWLGEVCLTELQPMFAAASVNGSKLMTLASYDAFNEVPGLMACKLPVKKLLKIEVNRLIDGEKPGLASLSTNPYQWRTNEVRKWLLIQGAENVAATFEAHAIGGEELMSLEERDLVNIGVNALGIRKRLLKAINELKVTGAIPKSRSAVFASSPTPYNLIRHESASALASIAPYIQPLSKSSSESLLEKERGEGFIPMLGFQRARSVEVDYTAQTSLEA